MTPAKTCESCGEYLPHSCAPVVEVREYLTPHHRRRRRTTITDDLGTVSGDRRVYRELDDARKWGRTVEPAA